MQSFTLVRTVFLTALLVTLLFPAAASACTIAARPPAERVAEAKLAVYGKIVARELVEEDTNGVNSIYRYRFRVLETYKGRIRKRMTLVGGTDRARCEAGLLRVGDRLGLVLDKARGPWRIATPDFITRAELRSVRSPKQD